MNSKQEEIREGIEQFILDDREDMRNNKGYSVANRVRQLMNYLHSQGVVIKVDRELPTRFLAITHSLQDAYALAQEDMKEAGYIAVESLIKENTNGEN